MCFISTKSNQFKLTISIHIRVAVSLDSRMSPYYELDFYNLYN